MMKSSFFKNVDCYFWFAKIEQLFEFEEYLLVGAKIMVSEICNELKDEIFLFSFSTIILTHCQCKMTHIGSQESQDIIEIGNSK